MAPTKRHNKKPIIPLTKDTVDEKAEYIKHSRSTTADGVTETVEERIIKVGDSFTPRQLLDFLTVFAQARATLHWTTGPKLFQKFRSQLSGVPLEVWLDAIDGMNQTMVNFDAALRTELLTIAPCNLLTIGLLAILNPYDASMIKEPNSPALNFKPYSFKKALNQSPLLSAIHNRMQSLSDFTRLLETCSTLLSDPLLTMLKQLSILLIPVSPLHLEQSDPQFIQLYKSLLEH